MSVVGLDVGTSRVKAVRFDRHWSPADTAAEAAVVQRGTGGRSEQDMDDVWAAAVRVLAAVARRSDDPIELVAVTAQGDGCWLVDEALRPIGPALLWNDSRAAPLVEQWRADGTLHRAFAVSGCYGFAGLAHAQLRWLLDHDPARVERAAALLSCGAWVHAKLTGRVALEVRDAANPFLDARTRTYDPALLDSFGLRDAGRLLPPLVAGTDRVARLQAAAATALGLPAGLPVAIAPYDVVAAGVGVGAVRTGAAYAILGTTLCTGVVQDDPALDRPPNGMTLPAPDPRRWLLAYATLAGTEVLDWGARTAGVPDAAALLDLAGQATRPDPPLVLPYFSPAGERSPFLDPHVRGCLAGLDLDHGPADVARGIVDGLTLAVLDCLQAAGGAASLALCGGGARGLLWCQAIADATGLPVELPDFAEVGARGAALVAAHDLGTFDSLEAAVTAAVRPGRTLQPDEREHERLAAVHERLGALRSRLYGVAAQSLERP